jgi:IS605 OrfB family transposase
LKKFTYQTRFGLPFDLALCEYAHLFSKLERTLFANLSAKQNINDLKRKYIKKHGLTARQFNSIHYSLKGKIASAKECQKLNINSLKEKIQQLEKKITSNKKLSPLKVFQKKRSLESLQKKLKQLQEDEKLGKVSICFGSHRLFREQFYLENKTHAEWKVEWDHARNHQFYSVGSKDETGGNQSCVLLKKEDKFSIRLRLPHALESKFGKYLVIENIDFDYGKEELLKLLDSPIKKAMTYRFLKDQKGWRVFVSFEQDAKKLITKKELGAVGVDINANHLALAMIDRYGNKIESKKIRLNLYGKSKDQSKAIIGDAIKSVIQTAKEKQIPVVIEELNFDKKKQSLKAANPSYARMLSSFSYRKIIENFETKAFKEGVELIKVSAAYTSMLGSIKYKKPYGLSTHTSAAFCIGRRGLGYLEKLPFGKSMQILTDEGPYLQLTLPARNESVDHYGMLKEVFKSYKAVHEAHIRAKRFRSLSYKR